MQSAGSIGFHERRLKPLPRTAGGYASSKRLPIFDTGPGFLNEALMTRQNAHTPAQQERPHEARACVMRNVYPAPKDGRETAARLRAQGDAPVEDVPVPLIPPGRTRSRHWRC